MKGLHVELTQASERRQAQPVNLTEARAWGPLEPNQEYRIRGFYLRTGTEAEYDAFKVVDASKSLASDASYTDQLGLITVVFYEPQPKPARDSRKVGVGRGNRYRTETDIYTGPNEPGRLLAVVNIRYGQ